MKVNVDGVNYRIWFRYISAHGEHGDAYQNGVTQANIEELDDKGNGVWRSVATTTCSSKDKFSYKAGRKIALSRALHYWPRSFRKEVWEQLFKGGLKK